LPRTIRSRRDSTERILRRTLSSSILSGEGMIALDSVLLVPGVSGSARVQTARRGGVRDALDHRETSWEAFRSIFWEVLRDHMGAPPAQVETHFPGYTAGGLAGQELGLIT
jgi:hypothetical protein